MPPYTVSVIVPVYNVEKYLSECLDSLVEQTLQDMQIILIDDGSTDRSADISRAYADKYSQIEFASYPHQGVSAVRQAGLEAARGAYLAFLDADDFVSKDLYKKMYHAAEETGADIVECNYRRFWENGNYTDNHNQYLGKKLKKNNYTFNNSGAEAVFRNMGYAWRIHRLDFIKKHLLCFNSDIAFGEDYIWHFFPVALSRKYLLIEHLGYFYRQRTFGNQSNSNPEKLMDITKAFEQADTYLPALCKSYLFEHYVQYEIRNAIFILSKLTGKHRDFFYDVLAQRWSKKFTCTRRVYFTASGKLKIDLIEFITNTNMDKCILVHGEKRDELAEDLREEFAKRNKSTKVLVPMIGQSLLF